MSDDIKFGAFSIAPGEEYKDGQREEQFILTQQIEDLVKNKTKSSIPEPPSKPIKTSKETEENKEVFTKFPEKTVVIDIETFIDSKMSDEYIEYKSGAKLGRLVDPAKIQKKKEESTEKFALSPLTGEIILVGFLTKDENQLQMTQIGLNGATEKMILSEVAERLWYYYEHNYRLVTYNGKKFDIPYIYARILINNINAQMPPLSNYVKKYDNTNHCDLFTIFEDGGLAEWMYRLGYSTTFTSDGGQIAEMFLKKEYAKILNKNSFDLRLTYKFYELIKGMI